MALYTLVGYDDSDSSRRALRFAIDMGKAMGGRVRAITVIQHVVGGINTMEACMVDSGDEQAREMLQRLREDYPDAGDLLEVALVGGKPGEAILHQVESLGINHIVIGHTERGALARWLTGSVSDDVLARAHVPVTIVR